MKSNGVGGRVQSRKRTHKSFDLLKRWAKALKIRVKIAPNVYSLQKMTSTICIKTHEDLFVGYTNKRSSWFLWEKICRQKLHKNISGNFVEIRAKPFAPQKFACSSTYGEKISPPPLPFFRKDREGNALAMPPFSGVPVQIILHAFSLLVVSYNVSLQWT